MRILNNPDILDYDGLIVELHLLIKNGQGATKDADLVREQLEPLWYRLSSEEVEIVDGLSGDLNMLDQSVREQGWPHSPFSSLSDDEIRGKLFEDWQSIKDSNDQKKLAECLVLLRTKPSLFSLELRSEMRAILYARLGLEFGAKEFSNFSLRFKSSSSTSPVS